MLLLVCAIDVVVIRWQRVRERDNNAAEKATGVRPSKSCSCPFSPHTLLQSDRHTLSKAMVWYLYAFSVQEK
jgi:hypothetical protein